MASFKDRYNPETIEAIVRSHEDQIAESGDGTAKIDPFEQIDPPSFDVPGGFKKFSEVFWAPIDCPDFPLQVFTDQDWPEEARLHIPDVDPNWVWDRRTLEAFALALYCGDTTLLYGMQGTGKSCLVEQYCATLRIPFWRQSCNRETREAHFVGSPGLEYDEEGHMTIKQEPTMLTDSLRYGGIFCEDEAFRHNSALVLQSLREKTNRTLTLPDAPGVSADDRRLRAPEGKWWYVLTDNTTGSGDETGIFDAEVQDASTLDRIDSAIEVDYLKKSQERSMLKKRTNLNDEIINGMIDLAKMVRSSFAKQEIMATISVRGLIAWGEKIELTGSIGPALKLSWYNKLNTDDRKLVEDMFHQVFGRVISDKGVDFRKMETDESEED